MRLLTGKVGVDRRQNVPHICTRKERPMQPLPSIDDTRQIITTSLSDPSVSPEAVAHVYQQLHKSYLVCAPVRGGFEDQLYTKLCERMNGAAWLPIRIRRHGNLNASLDEALDQRLPLETPLPICVRIEKIARWYYRPAYLIIEGVAEMLHDGSKDEIDRFFQTVREIRESRCCTVVLMVPEEMIELLSSALHRKKAA